MFGFDRQKKHSLGKGGALARLLPLLPELSLLLNRENGSGSSAFRFLAVNDSGEAVVPAGTVMGRGVAVSKVNA